MTWQVKVTNEGTNDLVERFKGKEITIKAGESRMFDRDEAVEYAAQYKPIITDGENNQQPEGFKKLSFSPGLYERPTEAASDDLICHATGERAMTKAELLKLNRENAHLLVSDDAREALEKEVAAQMSEMQKQISSLQASQKGPGRPKGSAANDKGNNPKG